MHKRVSLPWPCCLRLHTVSSPWRSLELAAQQLQEWGSKERWRSQTAQTQCKATNLLEGSVCGFTTHNCAPVAMILAVRAAPRQERPARTPGRLHLFSQLFQIACMFNPLQCSVSGLQDREADEYGSTARANESCDWLDSRCSSDLQ